jgi:hypothetical protein
MTFPLCSGFILFGAGFVVVFWLGLVLLRPFIRRLLPEEPGLNATLTMYLQYFGIEATLRQFDMFLESRRERLYSVTSGMPRVMWYTVALGALVNMIFLWLFDLRIGTHLLLGALVSFFTATMICLIAILDRPFKGEIGVSPEAFQLVYQQMMQD